ncbi:hypothetical protein [Proteiniclasticum sp. QWL-01]|nr:hypothetical protein [Proteiniclasticum sp. QWL-01]WFF72897.1 hypothetical protein P6M73_00015 [Proteiniclasticum sp. QWL-01]
MWCGTASHRIQSGGIPVALIPGNHDIAIASAAAFPEGKHPVGAVHQ